MQKLKEKLILNLNFNRTLLFFVFVILISCRDGKVLEVNTRPVYVDSIYDKDYRKQGLINNGKKEGLFNTYFKNEIIESEVFKNDTIKNRMQYYKGCLIISESYKNEELLYSYIEDYKAYLKYIKLDQVTYDYGDPSVNDGRSIYSNNCYSCHNSTTIGKEFYSKNKYSDDNMNRLYKLSTLDSINHKIKLYPADTNKHYIFGFLSPNDLEALKKFFKSDNDIHVYVN